MEHVKVSHTPVAKPRVAYLELKEFQLIGLAIGKLHQKRAVKMKAQLKEEEHMAINKTLLPPERLVVQTPRNSGLSHKTQSKG